MATRPKREEHPGTRNDTPAVENDQEIANRLFLERAELLPGILRVEQHEDTVSGERSFRIYVRQGDRDTQYAVYQLEAEIHRLHPRAYLEVRVIAAVDAAETTPGPSAPAL